LSYYYVPKPPLKVTQYQPAQEYVYQPPPQRYVYQPPPEEVLVDQPPEVYYQPLAEVRYVESPPQRYVYQPPPEEYYYQPPPQAYYYQPPAQRVSCPSTIPAETLYQEKSADLSSAYYQGYPMAAYPYPYAEVPYVYATDPRFPPAPYEVRTVPSPIRVYDPRELPIRR
jgi:hypothetical protein